MSQPIFQRRSSDHMLLERGHTFVGDYLTPFKYLAWQLGSCWLKAVNKFRLEGFFGSPG